MKFVRWFIGSVMLIGIIGLIIVRPFPFLFYHDLPYAGFFGRAFYILILSSFLCLYRVWKGPTSADRLVAMDILGIMVVGLCAVLTIATARTWYMDIGIAWILQSFVTTLAFSKFLEGKGFDD